ncbi:MAG: hypothetical protein ACTFAK_01370 [Candidatus Electronema sp. VV]
MCDDFLYHHNVLTHHFLFYHYRKNNVIGHNLGFIYHYVVRHEYRPPDCFIGQC